MDLHTVLVVGRGGEHLALARRDRGVALDELGRHTAQGLDAQRQWRDVQKEDVLDLARQDGALMAAPMDTFHGVYPTLDLLAHHRLHEPLDDGHRVGPPTRIMASTWSGLRPYPSGRS